MMQPGRAGSTTVRALGWTSFLTDLSSEAIYPLLPAFVKGLGGSAIDVGLLDGIANAVAAVVRLFAGGGPALAALSGAQWSPLGCVAVWALGAASELFLLRRAEDLGVSRALVASLSPAGRHGTAFGWYALVQGLMALPAGLIAGWLWDRGPDGPTTAFAVTAALAATAAVLLAVTGRAHQPRPA